MIGCEPDRPFNEVATTVNYEAKSAPFAGSAGESRTYAGNTTDSEIERIGDQGRSSPSTKYSSPSKFNKNLLSTVPVLTVTMPSYIKDTMRY